MKRTLRIALILAVCFLAHVGWCWGDTPATILDAPTMYKGYFGESLVNDFYLAAGRKDILGKWHPTETGPDKIFELPDGRIEVHEVAAYSDWAGRGKLHTEIQGRKMDQLSNAWLGNWEKRVADNAFASDIEKAAARRLQEARSAGKIVRIYDEINWQEGKWRSSNALPMGDTGVTLEERTGPVLIERIDHKWTEARLRLDKLRLKDIDPDTKLLKSPRLSELPDSPAEWADYEKMVQREVGKCSVRAGILTADGRLIVSVGEGAAAGLLVFSVDAGDAGYQYLRGNIYRPAFEQKIMDAAVKGVAVGSTIAVAVFLGATPQGWVVLGLGIGAYCITDAALSQWHEFQNRHFLNGSDLAQYGIEIDSVLDIKGKDATLDIKSKDDTLNIGGK